MMEAFIGTMCAKFSPSQHFVSIMVLGHSHIYLREEPGNWTTGVFPHLIYGNAQGMSLNCYFVALKAARAIGYFDTVHFMPVKDCNWTTLFAVSITLLKSMESWK